MEWRLEQEVSHFSIEGNRAAAAAAVVVFAILRVWTLMRCACTLITECEYVLCVFFQECSLTGREAAVLNENGEGAWLCEMTCIPFFRWF